MDDVGCAELYDTGVTWRGNDLRHVRDPAVAPITARTRKRARGRALPDVLASDRTRANSPTPCPSTPVSHWADARGGATPWGGGGSRPTPNEGSLPPSGMTGTVRNSSRFSGSRWFTDYADGVRIESVNSTDFAEVEAGVAAVREQVQSLLTRHRRSGTRAERVHVHRVAKPTPCWRITARIAGSYRRATNVSFTAHRVELGADRITVPEPDVIMIISARLKDDKLTLCIAEAKRTLREADQAIAEASDLLHLTAKALEQFNEPTRQIAATRALRAVSRAIANSPIEALAEAASAATDVEVLIRALQQPDAIETLKSDDPLGPARLRGLQERERLLSAEGGTLSAEEVANHLNVTRQAVNKRRQQGALVGLDAGRHGYLYPAWQFVREGTILGLEALLDALKGHDPWMQHIFMVSRNTRLNDSTPLEALRHGRLNDVLKAARAFGEHGAA